MMSQTIEQLKGYKKAPYEKLKFYQDICEIRRTVYRITERFSSQHIRLISDMRAAGRSAKQNIREGYKKESLAGYIHSIKISRGSLEELVGDLEDCLEDDLISEEEFLKLFQLYKSADYLSARYIQSLFKMQRNGTWKQFSK